MVDLMPDHRSGSYSTGVRMTVEFLHDDEVIDRRGLTVDFRLGVADALADITRSTVRDFNPWSVKC